MKNSRFGLVLSGGGARAAYQAGVFKGTIEILQKSSPDLKFPFRIVTGVSAGAINAGFLGSHVENLEIVGQELCKIWETIEPQKVIRTDLLGFGMTLLRLARNLLLRRFIHPETLKPPYSLLDASPLRALLDKNVNLDQLHKNIESGVLEAIAITATDYWNSNSISFIECQKANSGWNRKRRYGLETKINVSHILASASIPVFFSPVEVEGRYYGDGSVRNMAPLSPAIHLKAEKLMIVSVKKPVDFQQLPQEKTAPPSPAKVISMILNALILDQTDFDMERLMRINATLRSMGEGRDSSLDLRPIDFLWIQPSIDLGDLARNYAHGLPRSLKLLLKPLGSLEQSSEIVSYLLFDSKYCSRLVEIGYDDALRRRAEIEHFFRG